MSIFIEHLTHLYSPGSPLQVKALDDITLQIEAGEFLAIIGQSGSGKSTLVQHFNGLLKPSSGNIYLEGQNITVKGVNLRLIRQRVGMIFQYPEQQLFEETVFDDVAFGPRNLGITEEDVEKRVQNALALVGLDKQKVGSRSPFQLSGGQMRRVAIAGVLAMQPDYLILDEPTANLDPQGRDEILFLLDKLNKEQKVTIILVSHSMEEVARFAERIVVVHEGKVLTVGTLAEVFAEESQLEKVGLALPPITKLMKELNRAGKKVETAVFTPKQATSELLKIIKEKRVRGKKDV